MCVVSCSYVMTPETNMQVHSERHTIFHNGRPNASSCYFSTSTYVCVCHACECKVILLHVARLKLSAVCHIFTNREHLTVLVDVCSLDYNEVN